MKLMYGNVPINTLKIKHFEVDTNSATVEPSAVQAGLTYFAKGRKEVGTGKSFEFANYGAFVTNTRRFVPGNITVIEVSSVDYPIKSNITLESMKNIDFSIDQNIATIVVDGVEYDLVASVKSNILTITCGQTIELQVFFGKDNYI